MLTLNDFVDKEAKTASYTRASIGSLRGSCFFIYNIYINYCTELCDQHEWHRRMRVVNIVHATVVIIVVEQRGGKKKLLQTTTI